MSIIKKIKWRRGMEITPAVFEAVDRYNAAIAYTAYRAASFERYGLFPSNSGNSIISTINGNQLHITAPPLMALTKTGRLIITDAIEKIFTLPAPNETTLYITIIEDGEDNPIINDILYSTPNYRFDCCEFSDLNPDSLAIAKIHTENGHWAADKNYIPPSTTLYSSKRLQNAVPEILEDCNDILSSLTEKGYLDPTTLLNLLISELSVFDGSESPKSLWILIYKITAFLSSLDLVLEDVPSLPQMQKFNNDDIYLCLHNLCEYINKFAIAVKNLDAVESSKPIAKMTRIIEQPQEEQKDEFDQSYIKI